MIFISSCATIFLGIIACRVLYSILTKNENPKYLAVVIAFTALPFSLIQYIIGFNGSEYIGMFAFQFATILMGGMGIIIFGYLLFKKRVSGDDK